MMLQLIATMASILTGASAMMVIVMALAKDWTMMIQALGFRRAAGELPLPPRSRLAEPARRIRIFEVSPGAVPWREAA
jgi:hypothetical protein